MCDDVILKLDICDKYFDNRVKPKHLTFFEETTPEGNIITGYISQKPNRYLGSMVILTVNNEESIQFIQSMPKIHYFQDEGDILKCENNIRYDCYEKLDGSCLILYPLKNKEGNTIEIVPKTRGRAVADEHFITLYKKIDQLPIINYYKNHDDILIFELYGILNQHEIIHYQTGIDIRLISIVNYKGKFNNNESLARLYGFKLPDKVFQLYNIENKWFIRITTEKYRDYFNQPIYEYPTNIDAMIGMKHLLEKLNKKFVEVNKRLAIEGVVVNALTKENNKKFLKCKPRDIENKHKSVKGVPKSSITKEVLKYFDEYGSEAEELYNTDEKHHTEYLHRQLSEEYPPELIAKSKKKIERIFLQIWDSRIPPKSIHIICEELFDKYSEEGIAHCMRMFSQQYPQKKKDARLVYSVLEKLFIRNNVEL